MKIFHQGVRGRSSLNGSANQLAPGTRPITDFFLAECISPRREETPKLYQKDTQADGAGVYEKHRCLSHTHTHLHVRARRRRRWTVDGGVQEGGREVSNADRLALDTLSRYSRTKSCMNKKSLI